MPACPAGSLQQQVMQQYSYLFQMAQQLNLALEQLDQTESGAVRAGTAYGASGGTRQADGHAAVRGGALLDLTGGSGETEETVRWMAETGELGLSAPENKYLTRLELRVQPERRARLEALVSYDGGRRWEKLGEVIGGDGQTRGYLLHLRPRRCRQLRLRLKGTGRCRVYSLSAVYEKGSDGP